MKRTIIMFVAAFAMTLGLHAQEVESVNTMVVNRTDGTTVKILLSDVEEITFVNELSDSHDYVDLGLPSGTLWATCNVGANSPEEYGDYFAWGETAPKDVYDWSTYKWCEGSYNTLTKYCNDANYGNNGYTDNKLELDLEDDAAYVNWGAEWCMPSKEQQDELRDNCTWTWTTLNGVAGRIVTGTNGNSIFLPAAGYRDGGGLDHAGSWGCCWSRSLSSYYPYNAYELDFDSGDIYWNNNYRYCGQSVRAVRR